MFLRASAVIAALSLLISFFIFTGTRAIGDLIGFESYDKFRYFFKAAYYIGDTFAYIPLAVFLIAFFLNQKGNQASQPQEPRTVAY